MTLTIDWHAAPARIYVHSGWLKIDQIVPFIERLEAVLDVEGRPLPTVAAEIAEPTPSAPWPALHPAPHVNFCHHDVGGKNQHSAAQQSVRIPPSPPITAESVIVAHHPRPLRKRREIIPAPAPPAAAFGSDVAALAPMSIGPKPRQDQRGPASLEALKTLAVLQPGEAFQPGAKITAGTVWRLVDLGWMAEVGGTPGHYVVTQCGYDKAREMGFSVWHESPPKSEAVGTADVVASLPKAPDPEGPAVAPASPASPAPPALPQPAVRGVPAAPEPPKPGADPQPVPSKPATGRFNHFQRKAQAIATIRKAAERRQLITGSATPAPRLGKLYDRQHARREDE